MDLTREPKKDKKDKAARVKNTRSSLKTSSYNATGTGSAKPTRQAKNKDKDKDKQDSHLDSAEKNSNKDTGKGEDRPTGSSSHVQATKPNTETPAASGNPVTATRGLEEQLGSFLAAMSKQIEFMASTMDRITQMMEHMSQPFEGYDEEMERSG